MSSFDQLIYKQCEEPFPHLLLKNFYDAEELNMIWQELKFLTKSGKLLNPMQHSGESMYFTNAKSLILDDTYGIRHMSNILKCYRKIFHEYILGLFSEIHDSCLQIQFSNGDCTRIMYYHDGEYHKPHMSDAAMNFLAFFNCYKEPKKFSGGELYFPKYDYEFSCPNNSMIIMPTWVEHGVREVKIKDSDYYDGNGRYAITTFIDNISIPCKEAIDKIKKGEK